MAHSAGILLFRRTRIVEVLLIHPGGPYWASKDDGAWSIPKGEYDPGSEDPFATARREFEEETGSQAPNGDAIDLGQVTQKSGKVIRAFALEGDIDAAGIVSNTFEIEWPPRSGRVCEFPEVDRAEWFDLPRARVKINTAQVAFLDRIESAVPRS